MIKRFIKKLIPFYTAYSRSTKSKFSINYIGVMCYSYSFALIYIQYTLDI